MTADEDRYDELLVVFREWLQSWGAARTTMSDRVTVVRSLLRGAPDLEALTTEHLVRWMANPKFSPWTRVSYYGHLRSFFGWLHQTGRLPVDISAGLRRPQTPKAAPRPLDRAELDRVLEHATGNQRAWILLGVYAGLRAHEIAKIRGEDVTDHHLFVVGKGGKEASLPTHPLIWEEAQRRPRRGYWFPSPTSATGYVSSKSVSTLTTRLFTSLDIDGSIHRCRHTYGTQLLRAGVNVRVTQTLMRHDSLSTTALYLAVDSDEMTAGIRALV